MFVFNKMIKCKDSNHSVWDMMVIFIFLVFFGMFSLNVSGIMIGAQNLNSECTNNTYYNIPLWLTVGSSISLVPTLTMLTAFVMYVATMNKYHKFEHVLEDSSKYILKLLLLLYVVKLIILSGVGITVLFNNAPNCSYDSNNWTNLYNVSIIIVCSQILTLLAIPSLIYGWKCIGTFSAFGCMCCHELCCMCCCSQIVEIVEEY